MKKRLSKHIITEASSSDLIQKVFPKLKKGVAVEVSFDSSISKGNTRILVVKSRSKSKKHNLEKITLYPEGQPNVARFFIYYRIEKENYSFAMGNMATVVTKINIAKLNEIKGMKTKQQIKEMLSSINEKQDLTSYSDDELSMHVMNDEGLYNMRHDKGLMRTLKGLFKFTKKQEKVLMQDLKDDLDEGKKYDEEMDCKCKGKADCKCDEKKKMDEDALNEGSGISKPKLKQMLKRIKKAYSNREAKLIQDTSYTIFDSGPERDAGLALADALDSLESAVDQLESEMV